MDKEKLHAAIKRFRENGGVKAYMTPEKIAEIAYHSTIIEGVKCSREDLLEHAKKLLAEREEKEKCSG